MAMHQDRIEGSCPHSADARSAADLTDVRPPRWRKASLLECGVLLAASVLLPVPAQAQGAPEITHSLKAMLSGLPIAGAKDELQAMVGALRKTSCGEKLTGCYMTQSGPMQLYFFTSGKAQQTLLLVVDRKMAMPHVLGEKAQKVMGETSLNAPIISISTTDYQLDTVRMPAPLQKVVRENYFNVNTLSFSSGVQMAARPDLGGPIKLTMESMGVKTNQLTMRAAVVMPIPTDLAGAAGTGAATTMPANCPPAPDRSPPDSPPPPSIPPASADTPRRPPPPCSPG